MISSQTAAVGGQELGALGAIDFPENVKRSLNIGMVGRRHRLEWFEMTNGKSKVEPYDDRLFDSVCEARSELRIVRAALQQAEAGDHE